ncbi:MAG: EamA family transporter RarD [Rubrivivax sp.]|jgi:chloramphenicol-sensitive protein RarD
MNPGALYALLAFGIWGLYPLYLRELATVSSLEIVLHRSTWSLVFLMGLLALLRRWAWLGALLTSPRQMLMPLASGLLLALNWLLYVYAVQSAQVVEASLGYFINPLLSVCLGVVVLRERLKRVQWVAVGFAAAGVLWLTWHTGRLPWLGLALAATFAVYGLLRKTSVLGPLEGLTLESLLIAPLVLPWLGMLTWSGQGALATGSSSLVLWLVMAGPLTAVPLMMFAAAARRLKLATVGLFQYLSPSLQLAIGVAIFGEPFDGQRLAGFALIWTGLAVYTAHSLALSRRAGG